MVSGLFLGSLVVLAVLAVVILILTSSKKAQSPTFPYLKEPNLFTPVERSFLGVLEQAVGQKYRVMGKVRLADVIKMRPGLSGGARQSAFNRIQSKHLVFVACAPKDLSVQFVVEFDDQCHVRSNRQDRDEFVDKALQAAGVPIYHFPAKRAYSVGEIQKTLSGGASGADDSEITL